MQTAAWWQEKMNTQLASWAELRHDNLLYAKQSYTGIPVCSFPFGYVEPIPEFYRRVAVLADTAASYFGRLSIPPVNVSWLAAYFAKMKCIADTLSSIADKELSAKELSESEKGFLTRTMYLGPAGCSRAGAPDGWYADLSFGGPPSTTKDDIVVADVHTSPANEAGFIVGWVLHAGTGPLNMAFVVTDVPQLGNVTFVGPVMSYYEHVTSNFKRLTDEEWKAQYAGIVATRPSWANLFLANQSGKILEKGQTLITEVQSDQAGPSIPKSVMLAQNFPNPFNPVTTIRFEIPQLSDVSLKVFDMLGREVMTLVNQEVPAGVYHVRFDGSKLPSGVYFYRLQSGQFVETRKLVLTK
jgi:hypothetical protein